LVESETIGFLATHVAKDPAKAGCENHYHQVSSNKDACQSHWLSRVLMIFKN